MTVASECREPPRGGVPVRATGASGADEIHDDGEPPRESMPNRAAVPGELRERFYRSVAETLSLLHAAPGHDRRRALLEVARILAATMELPLVWIGRRESGVHAVEVVAAAGPAQATPPPCGWRLAGRAGGLAGWHRTARGTRASRRWARPVRVLARGRTGAWLRRLHRGGVARRTAASWCWPGIAARRSAWVRSCWTGRSAWSTS
ncbi:hypothetical protein RLIN73S_00827 [Rhodanobacter lindaniclasticus]